MIDVKRLEALLPPGCRFAGHIASVDVVDSTNTRLKALAAQGAPPGQALIAEEQTGGRGTHGRAFASPRGDGLYLSALVRPEGTPEELLTLTGWVAVAVRRGIERACGAPCEIKWLNDIYLNGRKLVGILTELAPMAPGGPPDWAVIGIGVNVRQSAGTFKAQGLEHIAASLANQGFPADRETVAAAVLAELDRLLCAFPAQKADWLAEYRRHCLTLGRPVRFEENGRALRGAASGIDDSFALLVDSGGQTHRVISGTVTMEDGNLEDR